MEKGGQGVINR